MYSIKLLWFLFLATPFVCGAPRVTPLRLNQETRIVGGVEAIPHEFPYIVDIRAPFHHCGGTIINEDWILTSASCSQYGEGRYTVVAGDHDLNTLDGREQSRRVIRVVTHEGFGNRLVAPENDIALMRVDPPFEINEFVQRVNLPARDLVPSAQGTVMGWGSLTEDGGYPAVLRKVTVPLVHHVNCSSVYMSHPTQPVVIGDSVVCYGDVGIGSCNGDTGGPIVDGNGTLVGIVSRGHGCANAVYPDVYTEVSKYIDWIRDQTRFHAEDPFPVSIATSCGTSVESSSLRITQSNISGGSTCTWAVHTPLESVRLLLTQSTLLTQDSLFVSRLDAGFPSPPTPISQVGISYSFHEGGVYLVTLKTSSNTSDTLRSLNLEFYSSGYSQGLTGLTGYASLTNSSGSYGYPEGGEGDYESNERVLIVLTPQGADTGRDTTITFTEFQTDSGFDYVLIHSLDGNSQGYNLVARLSGFGIPPPVDLVGGVGLVTFTSDNLRNFPGFGFNYTLNTN